MVSVHKKNKPPDEVSVVSINEREGLRQWVARDHCLTSPFACKQMIE